MNKDALYYKWPYIREFDARVLSCQPGKGGYEIELDQEGFYPGGGGQPCDLGTIGHVNVWEVQETPTGTIHKTDGPVKGKVHCVVDWARRMRNTQNHSGEHIVSGLIHSKYGCDNIGFHMETRSAGIQGVMTIDFNGVLTWDELMGIEKEANRVVCDNRPIRALWPSYDALIQMDYRSKKELAGDVRIIDIDGIDICACCGTHVMHTGEIGLIKILSVENHRKGVRVEMVCGMAALTVVQKEHAYINDLKKMLAASSDKVVAAVQKVMDSNTEKARIISQLHQKYYEIKAQTYRNAQTIVIFEEDLEPYTIRHFCDYLIRHTQADLVAVLSEKANDQYQYVICAEAMDLSTKIRNWNQELNGRGGGQSEMVQGIFCSTREKIENILRAND